MAFIKAACAALLLLCCRPIAGGEPPGRLVSLAPSLTEMVFALGEGNRLVGVTDQCRFPPETAGIPKIGGYQTPNFEAVMALRPDLVLVLEEHAPAFPLLDSLGLEYASFDHRTLPGILESLTRLGERCGRAETAAALRAELAAAFSPPEGYDPERAPGLLFVIGRDYGRGLIANAAVVGSDNLYDRLIAAAGYRNAYRGGLAYPVLSGEGIALLDPEYVVEAVYAEMGTSLGPDRLREDWQSLNALRAVKNGNIGYIRSGYVFIPGMRMILLRRELERIAVSSGDAPPGEAP